MQVLIIGYGEMGHALEFLLKERHDVHIWSRSSTTVLEDEVKQAEIILLCLPVNAHNDIIQRIAPFLSNKSLCLSIAKGLDEQGKSAAQVLSKHLSSAHQFGLLYGPMISEEILLARFAFADVALSDAIEFKRIQTLFSHSRLICRSTEDMIGSSWSVILKNVYAIMFGIADGLQLGDNIRGHLAVTALSEISSILHTMGSQPQTPYFYAGLGDLITTATSASSHHHELGRQLAGGTFDHINGEGVHTLAMIKKFKLFDYQSYPLFSLVSNIVSKPANLKTLVGGYLDRLQVY